MTTPATPAQPAAAAAPAAGAQPAAAGSTPPAAAGQPAAPGTPAAAAPPAKEEPNFARLTLQIRKLEKERNELKARAEKLSPLEAQLAGLKDPAKRWQTAESLGLKYEEWTNELLRSAGATVDTPRAELPPELQKKLEMVDELLADREARKQFEASTAKERQMAAANREAQLLLDAGGEKYALTAALNGASAVVQEYVRLRDEHGVDPDENEVLAKVEARAEKVLSEQFVAISKTAKGKALIAKLLKDMSAAPAQNGAHANPRANQGHSGLTNGLSAESGDGIEYSRLTPAQKRQRALDKIRDAS